LTGDELYLERKLHPQTVRIRRWIADIDRDRRYDEEHLISDLFDFISNDGFSEVMKRIGNRTHFIRHEFRKQIHNRSGEEVFLKWRIQNQSLKLT